jgi:hypothetical protein
MVNNEQGTGIHNREESGMAAVKALAIGHSKTASVKRFGPWLK